MARKFIHVSITCAREARLKGERGKKKNKREVREKEDNSLDRSLQTLGSRTIGKALLGERERERMMNYDYNNNNKSKRKEDESIEDICYPWRARCASHRKGA